MNSPFTDLDFERFIYRQGQLLASRDFRDQGRMEAARRWMHNSAMHNAWGVAVGYEFSLPEDSEVEGEEERPSNIWEDGQPLTVQPGIAYDCFGRELILPKAVTYSRGDLPDSPAEQGVFNVFLVASYREPGRQPARIHCAGSASSAAFPPPLLRWKLERDVHYGLEVPILFVTFTENGPQVQRYAASQLHPQARPRIASGQTVPGQTAWRTWTVLIENGEESLGLEVDIDTSDAGFQRTPCYFAWLTWPLFALLEDSSLPEMDLQLSPFTNLANEKPDSFTFRVFSSELLYADTGEKTSTAPMSVSMALLAAIRQTSANVENIDPVVANRYRLTVRWLGIEGGSCENRLFCSPH